MRIPFTPVVYEHAARFVGRTPGEVSRDAELMFEGHRRAGGKVNGKLMALENQRLGDQFAAPVTDTIGSHV